MQSHGEEILLVLLVVAFLIGILGNGFVLLVNFFDWVKNKKLSTVDLILVVLALSRMNLLCIMVLKSFLVILFLDRFTGTQRKILDVLWIISHFTNLWFTTSLSIFYFLRIANFSHPFFFWLKWRIKQVINIFLVGPLFVSLFFELLFLEKVYYIRSLSRGECERNESQEIQVIRNQYFIEKIGINSLNIPPFLLSTLSGFLLLLSLWKHTQQMQLQLKSSRDPSTEAHIRAMKATFSFLILFLLYYVGIYITYKSFLVTNSIFGVTVMSLYPMGHTLILILWNSRLRITALLVWGQMKCFLKLNKSQISKNACE
ncbi:taste receptor type 2 member 7-like [Macrotis lagotis]|uniref:taste receptor type 2 member 7-like n=1 Tax=Macrotis lagotis TaxID=92651 RepID=UPI003D684FCB